VSTFPDTEQLFEQLEHELGTRPLGLARMTFGHSSSAVYEVELPDRELILKINPRLEVIETLLGNMSVLSGLGLPLARVIQTRNTDAFSYVLFEKIPGHDLRYELPHMTRAQMSILAEQLVAYQRRVMTLPKRRGFGWVGIGREGNFASWKAVIERELVEVWSLGDHTLAARVLALTAQFDPYIARVEPICHLDDITTKNVIVHNGVLQGLVDFDVVCYGDPLFWLALTRTAIFSDVGEVGIFYLEELQRLWGVDPLEQRIIQFYSLLQTAGFIRFFQAGGDIPSQERLTNWFNVNLAALEQVP
jgi:aminoglycoside phosphotransferase (APT) family kinase protein